MPRDRINSVSSQRRCRGPCCGRGRRSPVFDRHQNRCHNDAVRYRYDDAGALAGNGEEPFITRARVHDLVVMGFSFLLVECGRPMLIAAAQAPRRLGTIMVVWKDAREPARALTAAMPLLIEAERVVVAEIVEGHPSANDAATVAAQLRWHGLRAEPRTIRADGHPVAALLSSAAEACSADLLVMGSYSTGPLREEIFGGCTRSILNHAPIPVFVL